MHTLKIIVLAIGAILLIVGSGAVTIAALFGKDKQRRHGDTGDESIEDV